MYSIVSRKMWRTLEGPHGAIYLVPEAQEAYASWARSRSGGLWTTMAGWRAMPTNRRRSGETRKLRKDGASLRVIAET